MLKSRGVCHKCGRETYIVNKKYGLCGYCNRERLGRVSASSSFTPGRLNPTPIKRKPRKATGERDLFLKIWKLRPHYCEHCGCYLGEEPRVQFFAHVKGKGAHTEERLNEDNIKLWCIDCHYTHDFRSREAFLKRKKE